MVESLSIVTDQRVNSALLIETIAAQIATPFSMASGQDGKSYFVRITTETALDAAEADTIRAIVAAHDNTQRTPEQAAADRRRAARERVSVVDLSALRADIQGAKSVNELKSVLETLITMVEARDTING